MQEDREGDRVGWCRTQTDLGNCVGLTTPSGEERDVCDHAGEPPCHAALGSQGRLQAALSQTPSVIRPTGFLSILGVCLLTGLRYC